MVTVRFYTRRGCHLCEVAEAALRGAGIGLEVFDVDADPELRELYGLLVPVTVLPDGEEMHYRVDLDRVRRVVGGTQS